MEEIKITTPKPKRVFWFVTHVFVIISAFFILPLILPWYLLLLSPVFFYLQGKMVGGCIFTFLEFGRKDIGFWYYYLNKLGLKVSKNQAHRFGTYVLPGISILIAIAKEILK